MAKGKHDRSFFAPLTLLGMLNKDDSSSDDYSVIPGKQLKYFLFIALSRCRGSGESTLCNRQFIIVWTSKLTH